MSDTALMKRCTVCKEEKPLSNFGPKSGRPSARPSCRACDSAYLRAYRARDIEQYRKTHRENEARRRLDPSIRARMLASQKKSWAKGGRERQQAYLDRLKADDFFKWKARKSYIWLTADELSALWASQDGRCALTGQPLDSTAELDHIIPRSRGGEDTLENARWLTRVANQAKRDLLDSEFLELCRSVVAWAG